MSKNLNDLINEALINLAKERELIETIVTAEENKDAISFEALRDLFKETTKKTDTIIKTMVDNYSQEELDKSILDIDDMLSNDAFDRLTLYSLEANYSEIISTESPLNINTVFEEENNLLLHSFYLELLKDDGLTKEEKDSLHSYIVLRASQSLALRKLFSKEEDEAFRMSNPDEYLGEYADLFAYKYYYDFLNETVGAANRLETITDIQKLKDSCEGRRKLFVLEFTVLNANLMARDINYSDIEEPISDYTRSIMEEAAALANKYQKKKIKKLDNNI